MHAAAWTNQMGYIIVIAQVQGNYGNTPLDLGWFTAINPWPCAITEGLRSKVV